MIVSTGSVVSTTFTVLVAVVELPEASVAVYVIVYEPTVSVSTVPDVVVETCPESSEAVIPGSVYEPPSSTVAGLSPIILIVGGVLSGYEISPSEPISLITAAPPRARINLCKIWSVFTLAAIWVVASLIFSGFWVFSISSLRVSFSLINISASAYSSLSDIWLYADSKAAISESVRTFSELMWPTKKTAANAVIDINESLIKFFFIGILYSPNINTRHLKTLVL